jgi:tetratricopeptide (TPR) repeat protein
LNRDGGAQLQNLLAFTVQILHTTTDRIVGTGFLVSSDGKIVTASHVVRDAGADPRSLGGTDVGVYVPHASVESKEQRATVVTYFTSDDDVVLLQLSGGSSLPVDQVAVLGTADLSEGNDFLSYGFRRLGSYPSGRAAGCILGPVEPQDNQTVQVYPVELRTRDIRRGMSGAAVLDIHRNLVVGVISMRWNPGDASLDDNIGWAINARVLALEPLNLPVQDTPYPLRTAPTPATIDIEQNEPRVGNLLDYAPPSLVEWVGRRNLLENIGANWANREQRIAGLIGFGGEGKSSLARRWLDDLLEGSYELEPDGIFWWSFYDNSNVDEFFATALTFISGKAVDLQQNLSSHARAHLIAALLTKGRYIFVLDGLDVMQHQNGDSYGFVVNSDLGNLLKFFGAPKHESFCLVSSRIPLLDLTSYTAYIHHDVDRLSTSEGCTLLRNLGVEGPDDSLERIVTSWDGYALALSLIGTYLVEQHDGNSTSIEDIPAPISDESRHERVYRVLRRYDAHLIEAERAMLMLFSMLRTPVNVASLKQLLRADAYTSDLSASISALEEGDYEASLERLTSLRILRFNSETGHYTIHSIIRSYYRNRLTECDPDQVRGAHARIRDYYLDISASQSDLRTLEDLMPLIEAVHHSCEAREYGEAERILHIRINRSGLIARLPALGASETNLSLISGFFPQGDLTKEPLASDDNKIYWFLNEIGVCMAGLGRLDEALTVYDRAVLVALESEDWANVSTSYENLASTYYFLGQLDMASDSAERARNFARLVKGKELERNALGVQAWIAHLHGDLSTARKLFQKAAYLERNLSGRPYLNQRLGITYCEHLRRMGMNYRARRVAEENIRLSEVTNLDPFAALCHGLLGDLDDEIGQYDDARTNHNEAVRISRNISQQDVSIETLLRRGRHFARHGQIGAAYSDLSEALLHASTNDYLIYEAEIRISLAWCCQTENDMKAAQAELDHAQSISSRTGYYWGQVDMGQLYSEGYL